ncbi:PepSY-associated TM helix domain-containing protein [Paracoccus benzoatiresistens]|uniref:PepSY-associated TM helix domain-containing protein n=1 Tax=Paracoccus benzoatiresistens TaxID=2997341 RepID=A0ABT4J112_9RHOB|nr:PepSY-associated TM helix domain-containing protein [Paracoccus sp. EF6]MCZ0960101.1 PepSY-associated TM helix domain-containing protein [Paracoccus sp. EF6]
MTHLIDTPRADAARTTLRPFLLRMHFYAGLFVGPFIFVAALTGLLYVLTPQIETWLYRDALFTDSAGTPRSLTDQARAAREALGADLAVSAVRPATGPGRTTRIMFSDPALGPSENRTLFVDPVTLEVRGDLTTYGTSGILPFRTTLDYLHRNMLLGDLGRYYSELAASWLWVAVLGGVALWATGPRRRRRLAEMPSPQRRRWLHGTIGTVLSVVLLFVSVTGLTWSQQGGARIDALRGQLGWVTPSASAALDGAADPAGEHAGHGDHAAHMSHDPAAREDRLEGLDAVAGAARAGGLDSPMMEIRLPKPDQAWVVREYDRSWPTQVDTVAINPDTLRITSRADFADFTLIPKLIRWGIDAHMGVLFGIPNQALMAAVALGLMVTIVYGYRMWWTRRPKPAEPLWASWRRLSPGQQLAWAALAAALGWALPVLGVSLAFFLAVDLLRGQAAR